MLANRYQVTRSYRLCRQRRQLRSGFPFTCSHDVEISNDGAAYRLCAAAVKQAVILCQFVPLAMPDTLPRSIPGSGSLPGSVSSVAPSGTSLGAMQRSTTSGSHSGSRMPLFRLETPFPALWVGFLLFVIWTLTVLALSSEPSSSLGAAAKLFPSSNDLLDRLGPRWLSWGPATPARTASLPALLGFGSSILLGWVWLLTAGLAYVVRPDGVAARAFTRWAALLSTLLIGASDFHAGQRLVPVYFICFALMQSALLEFVLYC